DFAIPVWGVRWQGTRGVHPPAGAVGRPPGSLGSALRQSTNRLAKPERSRYVGARPPLMHRALLCTLLAVLGGVHLAWAINPRAYVTSNGDSNVHVIEGEVDIGRQVPMGSNPTDVAVDLVGANVYVTNSDDGTLSRIDAASLTQVGSRIDVGGNVCPQP